MQDLETTQEIIKNINIKQLFWETNFNNKLGCTGMIHIDLAPRGKVTWQQMDSMLFEINTKDNSHAPELYRLVDVLVFKFEQITWQQSYPSHGMGTMELADFFFSRYSTQFKWSTNVAVYFYLKYIDENPK